MSVISPPELVLATSNPGKAAEFRELFSPLAVRLVLAPQLDPGYTVHEPGRSLADNARAKAIAWASHLARWVLADDTGLEVDALGGAPGVHTARFAGERATAEMNRRRLLAELAGVPRERRTAQFVCHLTLADPSGAVRGESQGRCRGRIAMAEAGRHGFGYDCLFEIPEYHRTLAQLGPMARNVLSHRARAVEKLLPQIERLLFAS